MSSFLRSPLVEDGFSLAFVYSSNVVFVDESLPTLTFLLPFFTQVSLRIVGMCSLHRIPTSNINLYTTSAHRSGSLGGVPTLRRKTYTRLDPPRDGTELGEQIGAFWTAFSESLRSSPPSRIIN